MAATTLKKQNMAELRQSKLHAQYMKLIGWMVEEKDGVYAYARKLPVLPLGIIKVQKVSWDKIDFEWIKKLCKQYRTLTCHVEIDETDREQFSKIQQVMKQHGFRPESMGLTATKTQVIDISKNDKALLAQFKTKTRYNLGLAKHRGLTAEIITAKALLRDKEKLNEFLFLIKENYKRINFWGGVESWILAHMQAFGEDAYIVRVMHADTLVAAALFMTADGVSYYSHNGSTDTGRKYMGPTLAIWTAIQEAKKRKLTRLDFDGVYDERFPVKRWQGYTRFKAGFGGDYVYYPSAYVKWLSFL